MIHRRLLRWCSDKESACQCKRHLHWRLKFDSWVGMIPCSRKWQHAPLFLLGKFHGQRSLVGYSPRGHEESESTEHSTAPYRQPREHRNVREEVPKENRKMPCSLQMKSCVGTLPSKRGYMRSQGQKNSMVVNSVFDSIISSGRRHEAPKLLVELDCERPCNASSKV